ncbi:MAG: flagellar basal body P-ring formation chaperone FlgA [Planctomycetota bacterium]
MKSARTQKGTDALAHTNSNFTRRWILIALLTLLIVLWAVGLANSQTVHLKRSATVCGTLVQQQGGITLGDIAELTEFSEGETAALRSLVVVPAAEFTKRITLGDVRHALRHAGVNLGLLNLGGFAACDLRFASDVGTPLPEATTRATREPISIPTESDNGVSAAASSSASVDVADASRLRDLIQTRITAALSLPAGEVVCLFDGRDDATLNQSTLGATFDIQPIGDIRLGRMNVRVRCTNGFGDATTETVGVRIGWKTQVLTATRDIARHERLSEANVALAEVTIDRDLDGELFTVDAIRGAAAASPLRAGQPVRQDDLGRPTLVKRGQAVTVQVRRGNFEMTTTAFADHDAALHEPVTLRSEARRTRDSKTFRAYVAGPGRVTVKSEFSTNSSQSAQLAQGH